MGDASSWRTPGTGKITNARRQEPLQADVTSESIPSLAGGNRCAPRPDSSPFGKYAANTAEMCLMDWRHECCSFGKTMAQSLTPGRVVLFLVGGLGVVLVTILAAFVLTVANEGTLALGIAAVIALALLLLGRRTRPTPDGSA